MFYPLNYEGYYIVRPRGIEPRSQDPQSRILSIKLWKLTQGCETLSVLSVGIEPTSQAPQARILSIELREQNQRRRWDSNPRTP